MAEWTLPNSDKNRIRFFQGGIAMDGYNRIKDFLMKRKKIFIGSAIGVAFCTFFAVIFILSVSKAQALESVSVSDTEYQLPSDNLAVELNVVSNGRYVIDGDGVLRNDVSIKVVPNSESVDNVEVVLKNVRIQNSVDEPVIQFEAAKSGTVTNYTLSIEGTCTLENTRERAKSPIISVQGVNASVIKLAENVHTARNCKLSDLLQETEVVYGSSLNIKNVDGTNGMLTLVTSRNSYGAAIGGGEANADVDLHLSEGNPNIIFSPNYLLREDGTAYSTVQNAFEYLNEKYNTNYPLDAQLPVGKEFFVSSTVNAGNITISGDIEINIKGQGYGAGIGGGGSANAAAASGRAGVVTINGGTIAVNMLSNAPCIGSGRNSAGGKNSNGNSIIIGGGSLFLNAANTQYDGNITDASGKKLYLFCADLTSNGNTGFSTADWTDTITLADNKYTNTYTANIQMQSEYATVTVDSLTFEYKGYGHKNISSVGINKNEVANKLYFYLPATPMAELTISDSSYIKQNQRMEVYQNNVLISPSAQNKYILSADQYVDVRVYDVPEELDVANVTVAGMTYPVTKLNDAKGEYYVVSFKMPDVATSLQVNYAGNIQIVYHNGFTATDKNIDGHSYVAPTATMYTYGTTMSVPAPGISDLTFDGWYVTGTDKRVSQITSADILAGDILTDGKIDLTAKWKCSVTYIYSYGDSGDIELRTDEHTYGEPYTLDPNSNAVPTPPTIEYYDFVGWTVNSDRYSKENGRIYYENSLTSNLVVRGEYSKNRYYVYIDKEFFNATNVELLMGSTTLTFDNQEFVENGVTYYRTLVKDAVSSVTLSITAKQGYEISSANWSVSISNASSVTDSWSDNSVSYKMGLDSKDIYVVNNNSAFIPKVYTITFYDGVDTTTPFKSVEYTIESLSLPAEISKILGADAININNRYDRYHKFSGWKAITAKNPTDPYVTQIDSLGNYIFVATWEETEKYPIDITVYDEETKLPSRYVGAVPYLYDPVYDSKSPINVTDEVDPDSGETRKVVYVIPGDNVYIEFVALDEDGNYIYEDGDYKTVQIGNGIDFAQIGDYPDDYTIRYSYESKAHEDTTKKNRSDKRYITIPEDVLDGAAINVDVRISLTRFTIQYWDLRGYTTNNPTSYTIFDEFEFAPLVKNVGWKLVVSDGDDTNYDDVTTVDITGVDKWSFGNLVLKADWPQNYIGYYNINITVAESQMGTVNIVSPSEEGYKESQSVFLLVKPERGYKLVQNSLTYEPAETASTFSIRSIREAAMPVIISPVDEKLGLYLLLMPGKDINITAQFEMEVYNIFYDEMQDGDINNNPSTYTVNDNIILEKPARKGYKFLGWKDQNGNPITEIKNQTGDIQLVATWKAVEVETTTKEEITTSKENETTTKKQFIGGNTNKPNNGSNSNNPNNGNNINGNGNGSDNGNYWNNNGGYVQTGDNTNVVRLILILACAAVVLVFIVVKTKKNDEKSEEDED